MIKHAQGRHFFAHNHRTTRMCPGCKKDLSVVALFKLVYTFRECGCKTAPYKHLVEQLWHGRCYQDAAKTDTP